MDNKPKLEYKVTKKAKRNKPNKKKQIIPLIPIKNNPINLVKFSF